MINRKSAFSPNLVPLKSNIRLSEQAFKLYQKLIFDTAGISMSDAKQTLVEGRLASRVRTLNLESFSAYYQYITQGVGKTDGEFQHCIDLLTTNETYFFRENQHFDYLINYILPAHKMGKPLKIWSSASSSGEEAYTLAMILADKLGEKADWQIYGTDISTRVLETAKKAIYPDQRIKGVSPEYVKRFLLKGVKSQSGNSYVIPELQKHVTFEQFNLIESPPPVQVFDVIFCRNVLIYFDSDVKKKVIGRLLKSLRNEGHLMIGHSESLHGMFAEIKSIAPSIYKKQDSISHE